MNRFARATILASLAFGLLFQSAAIVEATQLGFAMEAQSNGQPVGNLAVKSGATVTWYAGGSDYDDKRFYPCWTACWDTVNLSGWPGTWDQLADHTYAGFHSESYTGPYRREMSVTATEGGCGCDGDVPVTDSQFVLWVAPDKIYGPKTICSGVQATYSCTSAPTGAPGNMLRCTAKDDEDGSQDTTDDLPNGSVMVNTWPWPWSWTKPGTHAIAFKCGDAEKSATVKVVVPPDSEVQQCDDGGGCKTGCAGSVSGAPKPGARSANVSVTLAANANGMDNSGASDSPESCPTGTSLKIHFCGGITGGEFFLKIRTGCDQNVIPAPNTSPWSMTFPGGTTIERTSFDSDVRDPARSSYSITDVQGTTWYYGPPPDDELNDPQTGKPYEAIMNPVLLRIVYANGYVTAFVREAGDSSQALDKVIQHKHVTTDYGTFHPVEDEVWDYTHTPNDRRITKTLAPDGSVTVTDYDSVTQRVSRVSVYDHGHTNLDTGELVVDETDLLSRESYSYKDSLGSYDSLFRLKRYEKNNLRVDYDYGVDSTSGYDSVTVTERSKNTPGTIFSQTVYTYGPDTTNVRRRKTADANSADDQTTVTTYYTKIIGGNTYKTWEYQVESGGVTTTYCRYVGADTNVGGLPQGDYITTTTDVMKGKVFKVSSSATGTYQTYDYDTSKGLVTSMALCGPNNTVYSTEEYEYYQVANANTQWLKTAKNARGNYTRYVRSASDWDKVLAIKVSGPINGNAPSDVEWDAVDPIKEFTYFTSGDQQGMLETETVRGIDNDQYVSQTDSVKTYSYVDAQGRLQSGPTSVTYDYASSPDDLSYQPEASTTAYGPMGRVESTTDAANGTISYTYDKLGRTLKTFYGSQTKYSESFYESCCGLKYTRDEDGRHTYYEYDDAGRVVKVWTDVQGVNPVHPLIEYSYGSFGNTATVRTWVEKEVNGVTQYVPRDTTYQYDENNRVIAIDHPGDLGTEYSGYDAVGRLLWKRDGGNSVTIYKYDELNRLTDVWYNFTGVLDPIAYPTSDADVHYAYEGGTRLRTSMVDSTGTSSYSYDVQGRLQSYTPPAPAGHGPITYAYNNLGQKTSMTNGTEVTNYEYYANGWLKRVKRGTTLIAEYTYDEVGNRTNILLGNGATTAYAYDTDPRYRVSGITHTPLVGETLTLSYLSRDNSGNPTSVQEDTLNPTTYTYDNNSRLIQPGGYDWMGNMNPDVWQYSDTDQLTNQTGQHRYDYLDAGSLHYQYDSTGQAVQKTYAYTPANLLSSVAHAGAGTSSMTWDAGGNRTSFTSSQYGTTTEFVYDTTAGIPAVVEETIPSGSTGGGSSVYYIREPNGDLVARVSGETVQYYHYDALGSTRLLTDGAGAVTDSYSYDEWGNVTPGITNTTAQPYRYVGQLGYYTHYQDANFPMLQLGVRFYDAQTGRFTQMDPVRNSTVGSYVYVGDQPQTNVDPSGAVTIDCPRNKNKRTLENVMSRICTALKSGKMDDCTSCSTGPKQLQCLKDFCDQGAVQCGSRDCVTNADCGYAPCIGGVQLPASRIIICNSSFIRGAGCDGKVAGSPATDTVLHEMIHACGSCDYESSAINKAAACVTRMLK